MILSDRDRPRSGLKADLGATLLRLSRRLQLQSVGDPRLQEILFHPDVLPIVDIGPLLTTTKAVQSNVTITTTGSVTASTVPDDEHWTLHSLFITQSGGTFTHTNISLVDPVNGPGVTVVLQGSGVNNTIWNPPQPIPLAKNWFIRVQIDSHSVNGTLATIALVSVESDFT